MDADLVKWTKTALDQTRKKQQLLHGKRHHTDWHICRTTTIPAAHLAYNFHNFIALCSTIYGMCLWEYSKYKSRECNFRTSDDDYCRGHGSSCKRKRAQWYCEQNNNKIPKYGNILLVIPKEYRRFLAIFD